MSHPSFPGYSLPLTEPTLCDPTVQQYSGYLDITEGKHLFFWFFEFRSSPFEGPLVLWLNGGPGCSSSTGLLFELRPCSTADKGNTTIHNPYSWNTRMNMIFLDQPVGAGYSYITDGSSVVTSPDAAKGVYAFFELFITRFPKYAKLPFYIVGESHAGRYIPHIAAEINNNNKALASDPSLGLVPVNLVSIMIRNGLVDPLVQMPSIVEQAAPVCEKMIESCYKFEFRLTCIPADAFCWDAISPRLQPCHGYNLYDARKKCNEEENGPVCHREPQMKFEAFSVPIYLKFTYLHGDGMKNGAGLLPQLTSDVARVLICAGNTGSSTQGENEFILGLENGYHEELSAAPIIPWSVNGKPAGEVRNADSTAGNLTLAIIYEAGLVHTAPYDQPEATLDMMLKWINNIPIAH
ncbi:peptidase S10 serine carboxypeptidase [Gyrodon lividus]|nr:peptidase S10 serine carboxypeptidase [Gyrodon lividus]